MSEQEAVVARGDGSITFVWGGDSRRFRLATYGQLRKLQEAIGDGPMIILMRLRTGTWKVEDVREVIRLGLLGGGTKEVATIRLMRDHVEEAPITENVPPALAILSAGLTWPAEDPVGKPETGKNVNDPAAVIPEAELSSPMSTGQEPQLDLTPSRSTNLRPGSLPLASKDGTRSTGRRRSPRPPVTEPLRK